MSRPLEDGQLFVPFSQLALKAGNFNSHFLLTFGRGMRILQLVALRFIQAEFTGGGGHTNAFSKLQGFLPELGRVLLVVVDLVM